jgi:hypothetical protein
MAKCPLCNGSISKKNVKFRLDSLRLARPPKILKAVDNIFDKLSKHWAIDDVVKAGFLADIEQVEGDIIIESIRKFINKGGVEQGYNIKYLAGIIKNEGKRVLLRKEWEIKNLDRIPPKLKDLNEEH